MSFDRFSESTFRVYESIIANMVEAYPACITVTKADCEALNRAPATVAGRSRDSIKAYALNKWPSKINQTKWTIIPDPKKELLCRLMPDGTILAGKDPTQIKLPGVLSFEASPPSQHIFLCETLQTQQLIIDLCAHGLIPSGVRVSGFTLAQIETYQHHDVTFTEQGDGIYLVK